MLQVRYLHVINKGLLSYTHTEVDMDPPDTVIGEVIGQFYSFFGSLMQMKENITTYPGLSQSFRDGVLEQLASLESEWAWHHIYCTV